MTEVFADTFYFIALLNPSDQAHARARAVTDAQGSRLVTTSWVLLELANALSQREQRGRFVTALAALRSDASAIIIPPEQRWFDEGVELYSSRTDKNWSLTDCISFAVMRDRKIEAALTGDRHFEQAGFRALLR